MIMSYYPVSIFLLRHSLLQIPCALPLSIATIIAAHILIINGLNHFSALTEGIIEGM
jgi:hypothetical protein